MNYRGAKKITKKYRKTPIINEIQELRFSICEWVSSQTGGQSRRGLGCPQDDFSFCPTHRNPHNTGGKFLIGMRAKFK